VAEDAKESRSLYYQILLTISPLPGCMIYLNMIRKNVFICDAEDVEQPL